MERIPTTAFSVPKQIYLLPQLACMYSVDLEKVARFHEEMPRRQTDHVLVSHLEFHKHQLLLVAGATNSTEI